MVDKLAQILIFLLYFICMMCLVQVGFDESINFTQTFVICFSISIIIIYFYLNNISNNKSLNEDPILVIDIEDDYWAISQKFLIPIYILIMGLYMYAQWDEEGFFFFFINILILFMTANFDAYSSRQLHFYQNKICIFSKKRKHETVRIKDIKKILIEPFGISMEVNLIRGLSAEFDLKPHYQSIITYFNERLDLSQIQMIDRCELAEKLTVLDK